MNKKSKSDLLISLGEKVKKRRIELGHTQEELAGICGFDRTYISLIERGKRNISFSNLATLAHGLDSTISDLSRDLVWR
ncbi:MAG: transcriptional regulator [Candidatus Hydrogenedentota bacterium]|nr:MAG: transcriptional regulator [Candidatus Hydrogenedentota bacterium]